MQHNQRYLVSLTAIAAAVLILPFPKHAIAAPKRVITFPVVGTTSFTDDFGAPRVGHAHAGNDLFGVKGQPLVAAADGEVQWIISPEKGQNLGFEIRDADGYAYMYVHVNNDTPGTDNGASRGIFAYAPDLYGGNRVVAGQLLGWLGDSGNAESTRPHLHFEIHTPSGKAFDPYTSLKAAHHIATPVTAPALPNEILPFAQFTGGAAIALGEVDPLSPGREIITGAGPGGGPHVRIFSHDGRLLSHFFAFEKSFRGGIDVTTGDEDGDGVDEIIVGSGRGRLAEVRLFTASGEQRVAFMAYSFTFTGGLHVTAADLDGDARAEIVTGPLRGGGPHVRVFSGATHTLLDQFFPYPKSFRGGIDVAAYPATADRPPLIATTPLRGGGPNLRIYNARDHSLIGWFFAREATNRRGLHITLADVLPNTTDSEVVVIPETMSGPAATVYDLTGHTMTSPSFLEPWWEGGYDIAAEPGGILGSSATPAETRRRTTVRWLFDLSTRRSIRTW